jgi:hypothetical protein
MAMRVAALTVAIGLASSAAMAEGPRHYEVIGTSPVDGSSYAGDVLLEQLGETYRLVWSLGGQRIVGIGVSDGTHMAVTYRSASKPSLALYRQDGPGWVRIWTSAAGYRVGTEYWVAW